MNNLLVSTLNIKPLLINELVRAVDESIEIENDSLIVNVLEQDVDAVRQKEKLLLRAHRQKHRKKYTRKPGCVHPMKKQATERRRRAAKWRDDPLNCIRYSWGDARIDEEAWYKYIQPFWNIYIPSHMTIIWPNSTKAEPWGTKEKPYTVWSLKLIHKDKGLLWDGEAQAIYNSSCPLLEGRVQLQDRI